MAKKHTFKVEEFDEVERGIPIASIFGVIKEGNKTILREQLLVAAVNLGWLGSIQSSKS